jgi:hypothetical protein
MAKKISDLPSRSVSTSKAGDVKGGRKAAKKNSKKSSPFSNKLAARRKAR